MTAPIIYMEKAAGILDFFKNKRHGHAAARTQWDSDTTPSMYLGGRACKSNLDWHHHYKDPRKRDAVLRKAMGRHFPAIRGGRGVGWPTITAGVSGGMGGPANRVHNIIYVKSGPHIALDIPTSGLDVAQRKRHIVGYAFNADKPGGGFEDLWNNVIGLGGEGWSKQVPLVTKEQAREAYDKALRAKTSRGVVYNNLGEWVKHNPIKSMALGAGYLGLAGGGIYLAKKLRDKKKREEAGSAAQEA